jgi:hypothetical protein
MTELRTIASKFSDVLPPRRKISFDPKVFTVSFDLKEDNPYNISRLIGFENELYDHFEMVLDIVEIRTGCVEVDYVVEDENQTRVLLRLVMDGAFDATAMKFQVAFIQFASTVSNERVYFTT